MKTRYFLFTALLVMAASGCSTTYVPAPGTPDVKQISDVTPLFQIDDGRLLNQLPLWTPDAATRKKILVDNPTQLYGF